MGQKPTGFQPRLWGSRCLHAITPAMPTEPPAEIQPNPGWYPDPSLTSLPPGKQRGGQLTDTGRALGARRRAFTQRSP